MDQWMRRELYPTPLGLKILKIDLIWPCLTSGSFFFFYSACSFEESRCCFENYPKLAGMFSSKFRAGFLRVCVRLHANDSSTFTNVYRRSSLLYIVIGSHAVCHNTHMELFFILWYRCLLISFQGRQTRFYSITISLSQSHPILFKLTFLFLDKNRLLVNWHIMLMYNNVIIFLSISVTTFLLFASLALNAFGGRTNFRRYLNRVFLY